ncbi:MAG: hypothetical protein ACRDU8_03245, partial [Egibacteraceae bacterium]
PQRVGTRAGPVTVADVRVRPHAGFVRVVVELGPGGRSRVGDDVPRQRVRRAGGRVMLRGHRDVVPHSVARPAGDGVVLRVADVAGARLGRAGRLVVVRSERITVDALHRKGALTVTVTPARPGGFWLHQLDEPTRIVLDVRS